MPAKTVTITTGEAKVIGRIILQRELPQRGTTAIVKPLQMQKGQDPSIHCRCGNKRLDGDELILVTDEPWSLDETIATRQICAQLWKTNYNPSSDGNRIPLGQAVNDSICPLIPKTLGVEWGNVPTQIQQASAEQD
ncbi:hypothetical protein Rcae01_06229 [Novipirellula caenicola]|uniref:Uncharacterized protein n=1 Tax=Novipirellula caenicola TaxID=1536901 RepID=A0ABP9W014_9BACT